MPTSIPTNTVDVWFLGVESSNPSLGVAMKARVQIRNSSSHRISIHNVNFDRTVFYSFLLAGYAIKYVCGLDVDRILVDIHINDYKQVKGASASLAYTMAVLKALNKINVTGAQWGASGITSIDGFIDAVGGLHTKIRTAKEVGVETVYIPMINGFRDNLNGEATRVIRVASLADLCWDRLSVNNISIEPSLEEFAVVNEFFEHRAIEFLYRIEDLVGRFPNDMRNSLAQLYRDLSINVSRALEKGHGYTAANYAFLGYIRLMREYLELDTTVSDYLMKESEDAVKNALSVFNSFRYIRTSAIPLLVVILDRIAEAQFYIDLYKNLTRAPVQSPQSILDTLTRAHARSLTIDIWLDLLRLVNSSLVSNGGDGQFVAFNRVYATALNTLRAVSLTIEWSQELAPLSLSAIAATRGTLAKQLDNISRSKVTNSLRELYWIHSSHLDTNTRVIPYMYYIYAEDLQLDGSSDYINILSISTLILAVTNIIRDALDRGDLVMYMEPNYVGIWPSYDIKTIALPLNIVVMLLLLVLLLHIVEKGFRPTYATSKAI